MTNRFIIVEPGKWGGGGGEKEGGRVGGFGGDKNVNKKKKGKEIF